MQKQVTAGGQEGQKRRAFGGEVKSLVGLGVSTNAQPWARAQFHRGAHREPGNT